MPTSEQEGVGYTGTERRQSLTDKDLLLRMVDKLEQLSAKIDATHMSLIESRSELHKLKEEFDSHREEESQHIHAIMNAFPERDFKDHFGYHEQKRKSAKSWSEITLDIKKKIFGGIVWAIILGTGIAVWEYLKVVLRT